MFCFGRSILQRRRIMIVGSVSPPAGRSGAATFTRPPAPRPHCRQPNTRAVKTIVRRQRMPPSPRLRPVSVKPFLFWQKHQSEEINNKHRINRIKIQQLIFFEQCRNFFTVSRRRSARLSSSFGLRGSAASALFAASFVKSGIQQIECVAPAVGNHVAGRKGIGRVDANLMQAVDPASA